MFETDTRPGCLYLTAAYFGQLILSYPAVLLASLPFSPLLGVLGLSSEHPGQISFAGYQGLVCILVGSIIGTGAGYLKPSLVPSGRWVWALPDVLILSDVIPRAFTNSTSIPWLPEYLFAYGGNEGLAVFLFTLPACCATGYSLGILMLSAANRGARVGQSVLLKRLVAAFACLTALLVLMVPMLRNFERTRLEEWHRLASIIEPRGLPFSPDPLSLCGSQNGIANLALPLLRRGTYVERLGSHACTIGGPLQLEQVKVLDGPSAGKEGFVSSYGLLEH